MSNEDRGDLRSDWKEHPYTGIVRKRIADELEAAMTSVDSACRQSTDPKVRAAIAKLDAVRQLLRYLNEGVS